MKLRPYQQNCVDAVISELRRTTKPILAAASVGSGKSVIIANLAKWFWQESGKKVLVLAPRAELVKQNAGKYVNYDLEPSFFSASTGFKKETDNYVVFGTPVTVAKNSAQFLSFGLVIIDEADEISTSIKNIITEIKAANSNLRVVGMTGTPYRLRSGYIFRLNQHGKPVSNAADPFFEKCVYSITTDDLIKQGYLSPAIIGKTGVTAYDTDGLVLQSNGKFSADSIRNVFEGKGKITSRIVREVVMLSQERKRVIFFAATMEHAKEIHESLPEAKVITSRTPRSERTQILDDFKAGKFKYIINVMILTVGFDCPEVDCIAILRATESRRLYQQIIGRGLRICPEKKDVLILDYASNIENHRLSQNNLFSPRLRIWRGTRTIDVQVECPKCGFMNTFGGQKDLRGNLVTHYGRHCEGERDYVQCNYLFRYILCPSCEQKNDITVRNCIFCNTEIIDPNDKLSLGGRRFTVKHWTLIKWVTKSNNIIPRLDILVKERSKPICVFIKPNTRSWNVICYYAKIKTQTKMELVFNAVYAMMCREYDKPVKISVVRNSAGFFELIDMEFIESANQKKANILMSGFK